MNEISWPISKLSQLAVMDLRLFGAQVKTVPSWQNKNYDYYMPPELSKDLKRSYQETMIIIAELHKKLRSKLKSASESQVPLDKLVRPAIPLAATTRAKLILDRRSVMSLLLKIKVSPNPEVAGLASQLETVVQKTWSRQWQDYQTEVNQQKPQPVGAIIEKLSQDLLPQKLAAEGESLRLIEATPRNEFELLTDSLYPYSSLSRPEIALQLEQWNYQQKFEAMLMVLDKADSNILNLAKYRIDCLTDWLCLSELVRQNLATDIQFQPATPRYGYEVPEVLADSGAEDTYLEIFDKSLELFSMIQMENDNYLTQYAVLEGHKLRWQATTSADSLKRFKDDSALGDFNSKIIENIKEVHPLISDYLSGGLTTPVSGKKSSSRRRRGKRK